MSESRNKPASRARPGRLLGQILIDGEFIRHQDLELALEEQKKTNKLLGETLVDMQLLDPLDLKAVLSVNEDMADLENTVALAAGVRSLLGDLFIQARHITPEELELALQIQKRTREKLGDILVRLGFVTYGELAAALKFQQNQKTEDRPYVRLRLGELMITTGLISRAQLEDALSQQKISGKRIGDIFVESGYINHQQLSHGLDLQRKLLSAALMALLSLAPVSATYAGEYCRDAAMERTKEMISGSVQTHTSLKTVYQTLELVVTHDDLLRGFVDMPVGAHIEIQNTSLSGYMVVFDGLTEPFKEVIVKGLGKDVLISREGGWIEQPYDGGNPLSVALSYRFMLSENALPGTYAWPLNISVRPIIRA